MRVIPRLGYRLTEFAYLAVVSKATRAGNLAFPCKPNGYLLGSYRIATTLLNGLPQIPGHELRVPIDPVHGARHDVLLCRVDRSSEGLPPIWSRSRPPRRPNRGL